MHFHVVEITLDVALARPYSFLPINIYSELLPPPSPSYPDTTKAWLESVRLCGELVVGRRVLYYGVPFWRDAITVNVGHKMGPNLRLHFLRIVMLQLNASGSWLSRQRPKL